MTEGKYRMSETNVTQSEYVTVAEVAARLGVCKPTVYRMCQTGALRHIRTGATGSLYRIPRSALDEHLAADRPTNGRDPAPNPSWAWQNSPASIPGQTEISV